jgi:dTDP-4-dehydrorhamnose reductase
MNAYLPHQLELISKDFGFKLIHFSTDCVFSGKRGYYAECDIPDPIDVYGKSKLLGEVTGKNSLTIRTSIIGHGLEKNKSLIDWFLSQKDYVEGYQNAFFSGLPTVEIAEILNNNIFPNLHLNGLYHLGSNPINKYDLLNIVSEFYKKKIKIIKNTDFKINRVLLSARFIKDFGYVQKDWPSLIKNMHKNFKDE